MPGWFHPGSLDSGVYGHQKASSAGLRFLSQTDSLDSSGAFPGKRLFLRPWPHNVDSGSIELRLQRRRIVFLNHLHACPAVLGNLQLNSLILRSLVLRIGFKVCVLQLSEFFPPGVLSCFLGIGILGAL